MKTEVAGATDARLRVPRQDRVKVHEIFYSIQGESSFAGRPCVLVRLTGCQMRCTWCDTPHAFYEGRWMLGDEVVTAVDAFQCPLVELTGGEPLLQPGARPLMRTLCDRGYQVLLETGGGMPMDDVDPRVHRILDIKCPASGEAGNNHWPNLAVLGPLDEVKLVVADEADFRWAMEVVRAHALHERVAVHVSPVHGSVNLEDLASWVLEEGLPIRLQLQAHKLIWGAEALGV